MARPRGQRRPQTSIYETDLTESQPELLAALKRRGEQLEHLSTAKHNFKLADDAVTPLIAKLKLGEDATVRVGDFIITTKRTKEADVQFVRQSSLRTRIKPYVP